MMYIFKYANILIFQSNVIEDINYEDFLIDYEEELEAEQDDLDFYDYLLVCITVFFWMKLSLAKQFSLKSLSNILVHIVDC